MKFVAVSDLHENFWNVEIPKCDILLNAGDITYTGEKLKLIDFDLWIGDLKEKGIIKHCVTISGNHEVKLEKHPEWVKEVFTNSIYLNCSHVEIEGIKIWGSPFSPFFYDWAFQIYNKQQAEKIYDACPTNIDIMITHTPPFGIGDIVPGGEHVGDKILLDYIENKIKPRVHISGHIHNGHSVNPRFSKNGTICYNASICTEQYKPTNKPIEFELERAHN